MTSDEKAVDSDKKAIELFRAEFKKGTQCCLECDLRWVELFIMKTRQEAREEGKNEVRERLNNYARGFLSFH